MDCTSEAFPGIVTDLTEDRQYALRIHVANKLPLLCYVERSCCAHLGLCRPEVTHLGFPAYYKESMSEGGEDEQTFPTSAFKDSPLWTSSFAEGWGFLTHLHIRGINRLIFFFLNRGGKDESCEAFCRNSINIRCQNCVQLSCILRGNNSRC